VILCSTALLTWAHRSAGLILDEVHGYVERSIYLTSIGLDGATSNDVFLEQLADNRHGNYAYIDDLDEAQKMFVDDLRL